MALKIRRESNSILETHYSPGYSPTIFNFGILLVFTVFSLLKGIILSIVGMLILIFSIWLIVSIWQEREVWCVINRKTGTITYTKCGVLGSQYDIQNVQYNFTDIIALEMRRYAHRGLDGFQIRLALRGNCTLPLSSANLGFYECQSYATKVHQFMGLDIALRAID